MILRRFSLRPLTRGTFRNYKAQSKLKGIPDRSRSRNKKFRRLSRYNDKVKNGTKDDKKSGDTLTGTKATGKSSGGKCTKTSSSIEATRNARRTKSSDETKDIRKAAKDTRTSNAFVGERKLSTRQIQVPLDSLSNDNVDKKSEMIHSSGSRKIVAEMKVVSKREIDIRFPRENYHPCISCCAFLPTGELVLCDHNNKTAKLLDKDLIPREKIDLPGPPFYYMAVTCATDVLISIEKLLQFVQIRPNLYLNM